MTTKTISASKLRNNLADALDSIDGTDFLVITRRGKAERALIDLDKLEDLLAANDPDYLAGIALAREQVKNGEVFTHEEVFGDLD
ncbi:hypothetical protein A3F37_03395 [Candidatus Saccharibacteria bacterium RIFCSPHIGHO2_12_FULL_41_12]|nr:MAG: hypothetical protein A3F37_03395 [Candidatus Saccharibacteria bacterium RIFCSPHIGHO2_12_FULL_41_12]